METCCAAGCRSEERRQRHVLRHRQHGTDRSCRKPKSPVLSRRFPAKRLRFSAAPLSNAWQTYVSRRVAIASVARFWPRIVLRLGVFALGRTSAGAVDGNRRQRMSFQSGPSAFYQVEGAQVAAPRQIWLHSGAIAVTSLRIRNQASGELLSTPIDYRVTLDLGGELGLWKERLAIAVGIPVAVWQKRRPSAIARRFGSFRRKTAAGKVRWGSSLARARQAHADRLVLGHPDDARFHDSRRGRTTSSPHRARRSHRSWWVGFKRPGRVCAQPIGSTGPASANLPNDDPALRRVGRRGKCSVPTWRIGLARCSLKRSVLLSKRAIQSRPSFGGLRFVSGKPPLTWAAVAGLVRLPPTGERLCQCAAISIRPEPQPKLCRKTARALTRQRAPHPFDIDRFCAMLLPAPSEDIGRKSPNTGRRANGRSWSQNTTKCPCSRSDRARRKQSGRCTR